MGSNESPVSRRAARALAAGQQQLRLIKGGGWESGPQTIGRHANTRYTRG